MPFRRRCSNARSGSPDRRSPGPLSESTTNPLVRQNTLASVFSFSLVVAGEVPVPGLKAAATALLDIIRRVGSLDEIKLALQNLAADMEYLLFLSTKTTGKVGTKAVENLKASIEQFKRSIPEHKHKIIAFFLADDTKSKIQFLEGRLAMAIHAFQIALQVNTDEKVEQLLQELKDLKNQKQDSQGPVIRQDLQNLELNAKRTLNLTVVSVGQVERNISSTRMLVAGDFNSLVTGADGVFETMSDTSIDSEGDINFTTVAGSASDLAAWRH